MATSALLTTNRTKISLTRQPVECSKGSEGEWSMLVGGRELGGREAGIITHMNIDLTYWYIFPVGLVIATLAMYNTDKANPIVAITPINIKY